MGNLAGVRAAQRLSRRHKEARRLTAKIAEVFPPIREAVTSPTALQLLAPLDRAVGRLTAAKGGSSHVSKYHRMLFRLRQAIGLELEWRRPTYEQWLASNFQLARTGVRGAIDRYLLMGILDQRGAAQLRKKFGVPETDTSSQDAFQRALNIAHELWDIANSRAKLYRAQGEALFPSRRASQDRRTDFADMPQNIHAIRLQDSAQEPPASQYSVEVVVSVVTQPSPSLLALFPTLKGGRYNGVPIRFEVSPPAMALSLGSRGRRWLSSLLPKSWHGLLGRRLQSGALRSGDSISRENAFPGTLTHFAADISPGTNGENSLLITAGHVLRAPTGLRSDKVYHPRWSAHGAHRHVAFVREQPMVYGQTYRTDAAAAALADGVSCQSSLAAIGSVVGDIPVTDPPNEQTQYAELYGQASGLCCIRWAGTVPRIRIGLAEHDEHAYIDVQNVLRYTAAPHPADGLMHCPDQTDSGAPVFIRPSIDSGKLLLIGMLVAAGKASVDSGGLSWYAVCPIRAVEADLGVRLTYRT